MTKGGDSYIKLLTGLSKGWQLGGYNHRRHIFRLWINTWGQINAKLLQHATRGLDGKRGLRYLVTGAIKTHNKTKSD
jgi:hypothetical protein